MPPKDGDKGKSILIYKDQHHKNQDPNARTLEKDDFIAEDAYNQETQLPLEGIYLPNVLIP